jgi:hypothetical protein
MIGSHGISDLRKFAREYRSAATIEPISKVAFHGSSRLPSAQSHSLTEQKLAASGRLKRPMAISAFVIDKRSSRHADCGPSYRMTISENRVPGVYARL